MPTCRSGRFRCSKKTISFRGIINESLPAKPHSRRIIVQAGWFTCHKYLPDERRVNPLNQITEYEERITILRVHMDLPRNDLAFSVWSKNAHCAVGLMITISARS